VVPRLGAGAILTATHLGPLGYREALALQEALARARAEERTGDWLLFPDHPPVLTVGRNPSAGNLRVASDDLARLGVELHEVARGGDVTWHGPGQLVGYPIVDLSRRGRDLHRYLRDIETALIRVLARWGLPGERIPGRTGVWVEGRKIASIGVAVRRWVGYHGFALNVAPDLGGFGLIHPCGLHGIEMTSMALCLGPRAPSMEDVRRAAATALAEVLEHPEPEWAPAHRVWRAAGLDPATVGETHPQVQTAGRPASNQENAC
jgi:lipoyl(octanoyl) transferase